MLQDPYMNLARLLPEPWTSVHEFCKILAWFPCMNLTSCMNVAKLHAWQVQVEKVSLSYRNLASLSCMKLKNLVKILPRFLAGLNTDTIVLAENISKNTSSKLKLNSTRNGWSHCVHYIDMKVIRVTVQCFQSQQMHHNRLHVTTQSQITGTKVKFPTWKSIHVYQVCLHTCAHLPRDYKQVTKLMNLLYLERTVFTAN